MAQRKDDLFGGMEMSWEEAGPFVHLVPARAHVEGVAGLLVLQVLDVSVVFDALTRGRGAGGFGFLKRRWEVEVAMFDCRHRRFILVRQFSIKFSRFLV